MSRVQFKPGSGHGQTARYDVFVDGALVGTVGDTIKRYSGIQGRSGRSLGSYRYWRFEADGYVGELQSTRRDAVELGLAALGIVTR